MRWKQYGNVEDGKSGLFKFYKHNSTQRDLYGIKTYRTLFLIMLVCLTDGKKGIADEIGRTV